MEVNPDIAIELVEKRRRLALLKRREMIFRDNGLAAYRPHEKQDRFHRAGRFKRRYIRTGNRFGKSTLGAAEDCAWLVGERIWYPPGDPARTEGIPQRPVKGVVVAQDWDKVEEIFTSQEDGAGKGKIFKMLPKSVILGCDRNHAGNIYRIRVKSIWGGESSLYFETVSTFKTNPMGLESSDWDFIHIDEPCPRAMWTALSRGLVDRGGSAWFTCTPLTEPWINDYFIPRALTRAVFEQPVSDEKQSKWVMTGSMRDNPTLKTEDIDRFLADLPAEERETRESGRPRNLVGVVYREFEQDLHVYSDTPHGWPDFDVPPDGYTIRVAIDPHPKLPHAVLFAATAPTGQVYFYSEIFDQCLIPDLCEQINDRLHGREPLYVICDPIAFIPNPDNGRMWADTFWDNGLMVHEAVKDLAHGILRTRHALRQRAIEGNGPLLRFASTLTETLFEFDRYVWDQKKECPIDENDHMMECLYRMVLTGLDYVKPGEHYLPRMKPLNLNKADLHIPHEVKKSTNIGVPRRDRFRGDRVPVRRDSSLIAP